MASARGTARLIRHRISAAVTISRPLLYAYESRRQRVHLWSTLQPHRHKPSPRIGTFCLDTFARSWRRLRVSRDSHSARCHCLVSFGTSANGFGGAMAQSSCRYLPVSGQGVASELQAVPEGLSWVCVMFGWAAFTLCVSLPHDFTRIFVVTNAEQSRVAEFVVFGPLDETDLDHDLRIRPMRTNTR